MKKGKNYILRGGLIGGIIGFIFSFPLVWFLFQFELFKEYFFIPIIYLNELITGCKVECTYLYLIYLIIFTFLFALIGMIIGFMISKVKKMRF